jgi:hypothetical protein
MMMMIHMYFIVPDLHDDDGTHVPVLYQIYMMMMVHMYFIVPDHINMWMSMMVDLYEIMFG